MSGANKDEPTGQQPASVIVQGRPAPEQPDHFTFDEESEAKIPSILAKYPAERAASAVLPLLDLAQRQMGRVTGSAWLPLAAMNVVAQRLRMPRMRVYEVATFYGMFNRRPVGKYHLQVCTTTPCWLRGSDDVVAACRKVTGIQEWGETSADRLFTMTEVECLGACVNAPILQINDDYYEDLDGPATEQLVTALKEGKSPPPAGSVLGRRGSAPISDQTTLTDIED